MNELPRCFTLDDEEYYDFKCVSCGEKFADEMACFDSVVRSVVDVSVLFAWCGASVCESEYL